MGFLYSGEFSFKEGDEDNVEKIIASKETHQLKEIEFLSVEHNDRDTVANQPENCNQRLKSIIFKYF